jgi:putative heme-binding domain-containing protein
MVVLCGVALGVSTFFFPVSISAIDLGIGQEVFQSHCAVCHSVTEGAALSYGPSLHAAGKWAGTRVPGQDASEYILTSITEPNAFRAPGATGEMPENIAQELTLDQLLSVTAFLCSQEGQVNYRRLVSLAQKLPARKSGTQISLDLASVQRGRNLFFAHCISCHGLDPYPGFDLLAPSLLKIGNHSRTYLEEKIRQPNKQITPGYETWMVCTNGTLRQGRKLPSPQGTIQLCTNEQGTIEAKTFQEKELEPLEDGQVARKLSVSNMPSFEPVLVDKSDLQALVDFLSTFR